MGTSESSSEDDDEPPNEEAAKTARKLVVFNATQQLVEDPETATAFLQALAKSRFQFKTAKGIQKTCGEDFFNLEIPRDAKVKRFRAKNKGTGKKSTPGHISAQERDLDVLELGITKEESEMLKDPENTAAGPSGQAGERGRSRKKERVEAPQKSEESKKRKRKNSPRYKWIKFYHEENTQAAKEAKAERTSHQLLVHGLPRAPKGLRPPMAGPQEKILNDLMAVLSKETLGEDGINIVQDNIIGAHQIEPSPGEKTPITRITLDSRHTKASIRRAAEKSERWGNGTHPVFFRDITLDQRKRKSSNEDTNMPKKGKQEDTPRRGGDPKGKRLAPFGTETKWEERSRTVWQRQKERDDYKRQRIQVKQDQLEARIAKREHQRREEEVAQEKASGQHHAGPSKTNISPVQQFRAVNEENLQETEPPGTPENMPGDPGGSARSGVSETKSFARMKATTKLNCRTPSRK